MYIHTQDLSGLVIIPLLSVVLVVLLLLLLLPHLHHQHHRHHLTFHLDLPVPLEETMHQKEIDHPFRRHPPPHLLLLPLRQPCVLSAQEEEKVMMITWVVEAAAG